MLVFIQLPSRLANSCRSEPRKKLETNSMFYRERKQRRFIQTHGPWLGMMAIIITLTSIPGDDLPEFGFRFMDKLLHFGVYAILGFFLARGMALSRHSLIYTNASLVAIGSGVLFAAFDELHQGLIPGRYPDITDWLADVAGVVIIILIYNWLLKQNNANLQSLL